ncbi:MAG: tetratricopeptide repeat-containing protein [Pseudomonadota bacterium]
MTLARDAPDRRSFLEQTCAAGRELVALGRNDAARNLFETVVSEDSSHFDARVELAQVLNRLHQPQRAVEHLKIAVELDPDISTSAGIRFGRIYKDLWRREWEPEARADGEARKDSVEDRRVTACKHVGLARQAYRAYHKAYEQDMQQHWCGLNVVSLHDLIGLVGSKPSPLERTDVLGAVRTAARRDLHRADQAGLWAHSTLGECALLEGDEDEAITEYQEASTGSELTWFMVESMVTQLRLYESLNLNGELARKLIMLLEERRPPAAVKRAQVVAFAGHMIDRPTRRKPRFPESLVEPVSASILEQLNDWKFGPGSLGICGGAAGCDLLFADHCLKLGGHVQLLIPKDVGPFLKDSVRLPGEAGWPALFDRVRRHERTELRVQSDALGEPPAHAHVYLRSNDWRLDSARAEAPDRVRDGDKTTMHKPVQLAYLAVWDSTSEADGLGGTASFVESAKELDGRLEIIDLPLLNALEKTRPKKASSALRKRKTSRQRASKR